ncbi:hypothetical protein RHGRI_012299 [Rhododendron griersonianum]|uniref:Uncharacterized protein n=1 Tax=Rhododendron griersonianum TaxID=479676 RepID=A0AAV6KRB0_9ERIC|nr:hypothetical protein RHGRI_012299 [Rhododendron griersonianum]
MQISVQLLHSGDKYNGVLLEADFCSHIAFVKIISSHRLINRSDFPFWQVGFHARQFGGSWWLYTSLVCWPGLDAGGSIDQEMENTESRNKRTSRQLIKAEVPNVARVSLSLGWLDLVFCL